MCDQEEHQEPMNFTENSMLQELGYNFNVRCWPDVHALISKAQHDFSASLDLLQSIVHRADHLRKEHKIAEHDQNPQRFLIEGFLKSARAVQDRANIFRQVFITTCKQFAMWTSWDDEVSVVDSLFAPGQQIRFTHSQVEMRVFIHGFEDFFEARRALEEKSDVLGFLDNFWQREDTP
ncbi:MAG: hypothetical protein Q9208_001395 [Pyrenodesmia sp. 3 TL-2023]